MPRRPVRAREVMRKLERAGFRLTRQRGGHARFVNSEGRGVTVSVHPGDIPVPILRIILRQAKLTEEERVEL